MGGIGGDFIPNDNYEKYRTVIQLLTEENGIANISDFNFRIIFHGQKEILPSGGIGITDVKELDEVIIESAGNNQEIIGMIERSITELKSQRRLNVQEQLLIKKDSILQEARYWRRQGIPRPLEQLFKEKGIDTEYSIIFDYDQDFPAISTDEGMVLTPDKRFFKFSVDLNSDRTELIATYVFLDISEKFEIEQHQKGIGKTYGFLAVEVLEELNEAKK